jgi:TonB family protein
MTIPRNSNSSTANLDVPQTHPGPRIVELTPYNYNSFVNLPGERVIQSPAVTMHIQRSVWVRGGRWFWHGHKKVALGQLFSRLDPQIPRTERYGTITVQATIDKEGRITSVRPLYGSPAFLLNVSKAIREWRYEPTYVDNKPVETQAKIEVHFHSLSAQASK